MKKSFRDLVAFQRATELMVEVYEVTKTFPREEVYGLVAQLRRAAIGVMANIAEGEGRLTWGERRQFLSHARGSLFEVEAEIIGAEKLGYVARERLDSLTRTINRTGRALTGYINWILRKESSQPRNLATRNPNDKLQ